MVIASIVLTSQIKERTQIKVGSRINVMAVWKTFSRADLHVIFPTTWGGCQRDETQQVKKNQKTPPRCARSHRMAHATGLPEELCDHEPQPALGGWQTPQGQGRALSRAPA